MVLINEKISLEDRIYICSKTYSIIEAYFAHWKDVPDLVLDANYKQLITGITKTDDRFNFSLQLRKFICALKNGHTWVSDQKVQDAYPKNFGFTTVYDDSQWICINSKNPHINSGEIITHIDEIDIETFYKLKEPYISGSSDRQRRHKIFRKCFLFPDQFIISFRNGKQVEINQKDLFQYNFTESIAVTTGKWVKESEIAYVKIPSFMAADNEQQALGYVKSFKNAKTLIIDLRGNSGGSTPINLMKKLMDRNFKWWTESSPMNFALYQFYNTYFTQKMQSLPPSSQEYRKLEDQRNPYSLFGHPHLSWPSEVFKPDEDSYHGKLIILVDRFVGSASEDFVVSFKNNHRATLIGETTVGSTGQPFIQEFSNGINVYIGMKRAYFPDGSEFEGVGIQPDIKVTLTPQDHANPQDKILNIALDHISHK